MFRLRRKRPAPAPVCGTRDEVDGIWDEVNLIIALHNLAYHPGRDCLEDAAGRCAEISRRSTR